MNLYFQRSNGEYLFIKENLKTIEQALKEAVDFCKRHNYSSPYTRYWYNKEQTEIIFDVGSYTEYLKLAEDLPIVGTEEDFVERTDK